MYSSLDLRVRLNVEMYYKVKHFYTCRCPFCDLQIYRENIFPELKCPLLKECLGLMTRLVNKIDMVLDIMVIMNLMSKSARRTDFLSLCCISKFPGRWLNETLKPYLIGLWSVSWKQEGSLSSDIVYGTTDVSGFNSAKWQHFHGLQSASRHTYLLFRETLWGW